MSASSASPSPKVRVTMETRLMLVYVPADGHTTTPTHVLGLGQYTSSETLGGLNIPSYTLSRTVAKYADVDKDRSSLEQNLAVKIHSLFPTWNRIQADVRVLRNLPCFTHQQIDEVDAHGEPIHVIVKHTFVATISHLWTVENKERDEEGKKKDGSAPSFGWHPIPEDIQTARRMPHVKNATSLMMVLYDTCALLAGLDRHLLPSQMIWVPWQHFVSPTYKPISDMERARDAVVQLWDRESRVDSVRTQDFLDQNERNFQKRFRLHRSLYFEDLRLIALWDQCRLFFLTEDEEGKKVMVRSEKTYVRLEGLRARREQIRREEQERAEQQRLAAVCKMAKDRARKEEEEELKVQADEEESSSSSAFGCLPPHVSIPNQHTFQVASFVTGEGKRQPKEKSKKRENVYVYECTRWSWDRIVAQGVILNTVRDRETDAQGALYLRNQIQESDRIPAGKVHVYLDKPKLEELGVDLYVKEEHKKFEYPNHHTMGIQDASGQYVLPLQMPFSKEKTYIKVVFGPR